MRHLALHLFRGLPFQARTHGGGYFLPIGADSRRMDRLLATSGIEHGNKVARKKGANGSNRLHQSLLARIVFLSVGSSN
jgi:hypothetical protein